MHSVRQRQHEILHAQSDEIFNNKPSDLEVLFQVQLSQICFAISLPQTLRFFEPRRLVSVYFLLFLLSLIEPLHRLNLRLTTCCFDLRQAQMWLMTQDL